MTGMPAPFSRFTTDEKTIRHFWSIITSKRPEAIADDVKSVLVKVFENTECDKLIRLAESIHDGLWDHLFLALEDENIFGSEEMSRTEVS